VAADLRPAPIRLGWFLPALELQRARLLVAGAFGGYFALLAALGGYERWSRLGVSSGPIWFGDLRALTSGWDCARRGIDIVHVNPCDPWRRPMYYPRLWLLPYHLGLGQGDTMWLGFVVVAVFLIAAVFVVPPGASLRLGATYALLACSPAAMLGVERANIDLTLFPVILFAVLVSRRGPRGLLVSGASLLLAAVLKLYPVFATGFLVRRGERPRVRVAAAVVAIFGVYVLALFHQLHEEVSAVPQGDIFSFGVRRVSEWISAAASESVSGRLTSWRAWDVVIVAAVAGAAWLLARRRTLARWVVAAGATGTRDLDLFWAGACVYVFTYPLAREFDYRLIFLLLTVPQLVHWARAGSRFAVLTIGAAIIATWLDEWTHPPLLGGALAWWNRLTAVGPYAQELQVVVVGQLVLFGALVAWLAATAPWLRRQSTS
jgi:hypothetical protein